MKDDAVVVRLDVFRLVKNPKYLFVSFKQETGSKQKYIKILRVLNSAFDEIRLKK